MPLSPAEVHNVAFKKPPIGKRGYDEEEVDAFLDVVEVELSRLIEENNDLKGRGDNGASSPQAATAGVPDEALSTELASAKDENRRLQTHIAELERTLSKGKNGAQQQVVELQQKLKQTEEQLAESRERIEAAQATRETTTPDGTEHAAPDVHVQAVQILALAQQTADQHLAQSKAEAERLLTEANAAAESTISQAKAHSDKQLGDAESRAKQLDEQSTSRATRTVQDAEKRAANLTSQFEQRKLELERRVEELRNFEREHHARLKSYLESQLRDLDMSTKAEPAAPPAGTPDGARVNPQKG